MVNVTTRSYSNYRDGANFSETRLTSEYVQKHGVRRLGSLKLGDLRGAEGQPLVMSGITMRDGLKHNVAFVVDMSNNVFAFDLNITNYDVPPTAYSFQRFGSSTLAGRLMSIFRLTCGRSTKPGEYLARQS
jgi:hypothetical protein